jgi:hypothetical protein
VTNCQRVVTLRKNPEGTANRSPGAALNGYEELLEPALMMHDVSFWVNYECLDVIRGEENMDSTEKWPLTVSLMGL